MGPIARIFVHLPCSVFGLGLVGVLVLGCSGATPSPAPNPNKEPDAKTSSEAKAPAAAAGLETDEGVRAAYNASTGRQLGDDDCIERPPDFPGVILLGSFAHDLGCSTMGLFIDGELQDRQSSGTWSQRVLETVNYANGTAQRRPALARAYVDQVAHAFAGRFVTASPKAFAVDGTPDYQPVAATATTSGTTISGWTRLPSGMVHEQRYLFKTYTITDDGHVTAQRGEEFAVPGDKL